MWVIEVPKLPGNVRALEVTDAYIKEVVARAEKADGLPGYHSANTDEQRRDLALSYAGLGMLAFHQFGSLRHMAERVEEWFCSQDPRLCKAARSGEIQREICKTLRIVPDIAARYAPNWATNYLPEAVLIYATNAIEAALPVFAKQVGADRDDTQRAKGMLTELSNWITEWR